VCVRSEQMADVISSTEEKRFAVSHVNHQVTG
jgi:hypothetical protein